MYGIWRAVVVVPVALALGCSGPAGGDRANLGPEDFIARPGPADASARTDVSGRERTPGSGRLVTPIDASAFARQDVVLVPPPTEAFDLAVSGPRAEASGASPAGSSMVLLDVKVGEVNNKPIFASEFLDPLEQRLRALAYTDVAMPGGGTVAQLKPLSLWQREAAEVINQQLVTFVNNELVIAEGLASFTPAQRSGLRNFLGLVEENLARQSGGSITRAVRELGTGQTLSEYLQDVRNRELISKFAEDLQRSVVVTRSDVERLYLRRYGDDRKKSTARFRRIRVPADDAEGLARISGRLGTGEPFSEVATDPANNSFRSRGGLWPDFEFEGPLEEAVFFGNDPVVEQAIDELTPGEWAGPVEDGRNVHWIYFESIEIGFKTWAEAQSELRSQLLDERLDAAYQRAMQRLYEKAGMTDLNVMGNELLAVATNWFYPEP